MPLVQPAPKVVCVRLLCMHSPFPHAEDTLRSAHCTCSTLLSCSLGRLYAAVRANACRTSPLHAVHVYRRLLYRHAVAAQLLHPEPIFILGHPRSGTTHMHNLLSLDPRLAFATTFHAGTVLAGWGLHAGTCQIPMAACMHACMHACTSAVGMQVASVPPATPHPIACPPILLFAHATTLPAVA